MDALVRPRPEWKLSQRPVPYPEALAEMEARANAIAAGRAGADVNERTRELVWLLEHPPIYTAGTSAKDADLIDARFPVYRSGRGGQFTYHGPGQRVGYVMLDLKQRARPERGPDVRAYVQDLEQWLIETLALFGVTGERRPGRVGIWVARGEREDKIAALGVRIRHWVSFHGVALNVEPDLGHFSGIVPCGVREHGVTSLADLGIAVGMAEVDAAMKKTFEKIFG